MKRLRLIFMTLLAMVLAVGFATSCSSDDDDDGAVAGFSQSLVGEWVQRSPYGDDYILFYSNGTGKVWAVEDGEVHHTESFKVLSASGNVMTVKQEDETTTIYWKITDNKLYFSDEKDMSYPEIYERTK